MSPIKYDLYKNPPRKDGKTRQKLHARVVSYKTIESDQLIYDMQEGCTLTPADIEASLNALNHSLVRLLKSGFQVHIKGLGYFGLTLDCPRVDSAKEVRAELVRFKSVTFRSEQELKRQFGDIHVVRNDMKNHSRQYSGIEVDALLTDYFADHEYILTKEFCWLCGMTRTTAMRRINELIKAGKLHREGGKGCPFYVPVPGNYRKGSER